MSKFLVTYHNGQMPTDAQAMEQAKAAFGKWLQEAGDAVIDAGAPVKMVSQVAAGNPSSAVDFGGYSIIQAVNETEVVKILKSHPFVGRGGTLQINQIMTI